MPQEGQESVTIPTYVWQMAEEHFKKHEKELRKKGVKSTTALISYWIERDSVER